MAIGFDMQGVRMRLRCEDQCTDAALRWNGTENGGALYVTAEKDRPCFAECDWPALRGEGLTVLGDTWERSYGDLCFLPLEKNDRAMPWYFIATDGDSTLCMGVKTQPNAFVSFRCTKEGVRAVADCRNGANGVLLGGRELHLCTFVCRTYTGISTFEALQHFLRTLCDCPMFPAFPVYGGNDWYYAYGNNSFESAVNDARLQRALAPADATPPFMVIDDGWEQGSTAGPWLPNEKFGDMKAVCDAIKAEGCRPGLWMRPLCTEDKNIPEEMKILRDGKREYLDPTHPAVQRMIRKDIERIRGWGFALIKHDYSTYDLFGDWGINFSDTIINAENWQFYDQTKTNAEIVLGLYKLIREAAGDMLVIGCNTVSHLCAGLVEINRTGDDTSGREWARTLKMGVNTLAFRLAQNGAFYMVDADCVGILDNLVPWEKNRQWLRLLSLSETALFVSCSAADDTQKRDLAAAYAAAQKPHGLIPLDWFASLTPARWKADGEEIIFDWS